MATNRDYLPQKEAELVDWADNFLAHVSANAAAWEIPQAEVEDLRTAVELFKQLHEKSAGPERTAVIVADKNTAKTAMTGKIRAMVNFRIKNPAITDGQRIAMGLHVHDDNPTPIGPPASRPEFAFKVKDIRRLDVEFHDMESGKKGRPYGINGAVIAWAVLDEPPADISALTRSVLATKSPYTLEFTEAERGKKVYAAVCWQNERGVKGPFSEIEFTIIP